ncbi:hypothetical protein HanXRQr2_Chr15g0716521 [Helianthus annuus]|uniref:Uncharacterized protein n=1 Tax=Helianthus annuus TaxID=4232 RepID=A0A9K3H6E5_HELAN|nr:hypothetical protein HanXRQr2_Chr15g0716521 [Helianthus annuus]KAJ0833196.1 hypothetical protein HanPSC8_Chr15g0687501 [Helianthus annuus]
MISIELIPCEIRFRLDHFKRNYMPINTLSAMSFVSKLVPTEKLCRSVYSIVNVLISIKRQFKVISRAIQLK